MNKNPSAVTELLVRIRAHDVGARDRLIELVYDTLCAMAQSRVAREAVGHTLPATALVHEAYLRLFQPEDPTFENRFHFFAAAAEAMRRILVDHSRKKNALKRGGGAIRAEIEMDHLEAPLPLNSEAEGIGDAIEALSKIDARAAEVVKLRFFVGLSIPETAAGLGQTESEIRADWSFGKSWLARHLRSSP